MFTQSMYFRVSVIQNEVKDLANVSCEVPARDPLGKPLYYLLIIYGHLRALFTNICVNINNIAKLFLNINTHERPINFRE